MQTMMQVIKSDKVNGRGFRNVIDGNSGFLEAFEFNQASPLVTSLAETPTVTIDPATGLFKVAFPGFVPSQMISAPQGTTHFRIVSASAAINFANETYKVDEKTSGDLPWDANPTQPLELDTTVSTQDAQLLCQVIGILYSQEVNGTVYPLYNGAYNSLAIVKVTDL
jgi:hypothetical protein